VLASLCTALILLASVAALFLFALLWLRRKPPVTAAVRMS
jgi:hypothetical protein